MSRFIVCFHKNDSEVAQTLCKHLTDRGHAVVCDSHPNKESLWDGGWARLDPKADVVVLLATKAFGEYLVRNEPDALHNTVKNRLMQHTQDTTILPVLVERSVLPDSMAGLVSLYVPDQQPGIVAERVVKFASELSVLRARGFIKNMRGISVAMLLITIALFLLLNLNALIRFQDVVSTIFMMALGGLAATSHLLFNLTGQLREDTFDVKKVDENYLRIISGAIMGWLAFAILNHSDYAEKDGFLGLAMVATFLAGFSSKLVLAIIDQAIDAVARGLKLEREPKSPREAEVRNDGTQNQT